MHFIPNLTQATRPARALLIILLTSCLHLATTPSFIVTTVIAKPAPRPVIGKRAVVIDERLSALRESPSLTGDLIQRLRRGRAVGILREIRTRDGSRFCRVFVTRRTTGWILAEALARSGSEADGQRLLEIISVEKDGFAKVRLASIFIAEFGRTRSAPNGYLVLAESAEAAAGEITRNALRRLAPAQREAKYLLNDVGLDRYNRIGVRFRFNGERLIYDGRAYRDLLRRYPRSQEAEVARSRTVNAPDTSR